MKKITSLLLLLVLTLTGCHWILFTGALIFKGNDTPPEFDILFRDKKTEKRVAVVPRTIYSNAYELQNAPQEIAQRVNQLLEEHVRNNARPNQKNTKLHIIEQSKVEAWLDNCNNTFDDFVEVGRDKSLKADIVIGFDIINFQIRDPQNPYLMQGKCTVQVKAFDCATGDELASKTLTITDPPNGQIPVSHPNADALFRQQFARVVVAEQIAALFHYHDKHKLQRIDADSLGMH